MATMGNAVNASNIPNQSNITSTIKSKISMADTIIEIIIKSSTKHRLSSENMTRNMVNYRNTVNVILGDDGIIAAYLTGADNMIKLNKTKSTDQQSAISMIANFQKEIEGLIKGLSKLKITDSQIKKIVSNLKPVNTIVEEIAKNGINVDLVESALKSFEPFKQLLTTISNIFNEINKVAAPKLIGVKIHLIRWYLFRLTLLSGSISLFKGMAPIFRSSVAALKQFNKLTEAISNVFINISSTKLGIKTLIKLKLIPKMLKKLTSIIFTINDLAVLIRTLKGIKDVLILVTLFQCVNSVFETIHAMHVGPLMGIKIKRIARALGLLNKVIFQLRRIRANSRMILKILALRLMIVNLALLFINIVLVTPIIVLALPVLLVLWGAMALFRIIMVGIIKILIKLARRSILGLLAVMLITSIMLTIALMFLVIAIVAQKVVKSALWILGLFVLIFAVVSIAVGFGLLAAALAPVALVMILGFGLIMIVITMIAIMAAALWVIQYINLDPELVREKVECVISTALYIVETLFYTKDKDSQKSNKGWIRSILEFVGGAIVQVISAILAVAFLATMLVAIFMILLIATQLRLLQELELDPEKIAKNVNIVLQTAQDIVDILFGSPEAQSEKSDKSWFRSLAEWIGGPIVSVVSAILAMAYLTPMVIAVFSIVLIAAQLRLLQTLNLLPDKIKENVNVVLTTANDIVNAIFYGADADSKESDKSWLDGLFNFIGGPIKAVMTAVMAMSMVATIFASIFALVIISKTLKLLEDIDISPEKISENVKKIVDASQHVIDAIMNRQSQKAVAADKDEKGWFEGALDWIGGGIKKLLGAFSAMAWFGKVMIVSSLMKTLAEHVSYISTVQIAPNIKGKVNEIANAADSVIAAINGKRQANSLKLSSSDNNKRKVIQNLFPELKDGAESLTQLPYVADAIILSGMYKNMNDALSVLHDLPDTSSAASKAATLRKTVDDLLNQLKSDPIKLNDKDQTANDRIEYIERINASVKTLSEISDAKLKKSKNAVEGHINLLKEINKVDAGKLSTTATMFEQMAKFSESVNGNFDKLANTLNEKVLPNVKKLKESVDNLPSSFEKALTKVKVGMEYAHVNENAQNAILNNLKGDGWSNSQLNTIKKQMKNNADKVEAPELLIQIIGILMQLSNGQAFKTTTV